MRERFNSADTVGAVLGQIPLIVCNSKKPMERTRNGARYFRNPPQPHMCIQDYIEGCDQLCFINVLSWVKISTPRRPEDPIPLYGGMRVPYSGSAALTVTNNKMPKHQPVIFAVMANPEILRLSGKTAQDPSDRDALVELMIDFVEAMNPDIKFKRQFEVLRDRDLAGELKDIWLAVQVKRERERGENGKRGDCDRGRESKEDHVWKEEVKDREVRNEKRELAGEDVTSVYQLQEYQNIRQERCRGESKNDIVQLQNERKDQETLQVQSKKTDSDSLPACFSESPCEGVKGNMYAESIIHTSVALNTSLMTPSTETVLEEVQFHDKTHIRKESGSTISTSWNESSELMHTQGQPVEKLIPSELPKQNVPTDIAEASNHSKEELSFPLFSDYSNKDQISSLGASSNTGGEKAVDETSLVKCDHNYIMDHNYHNFNERNMCNKREVSPDILTYRDIKSSHPGNVRNELRKENSKDGSLASDHSFHVKKSKETSVTSEHSYHVMKSNFKNTTLATPNDIGPAGDRNILSNYKSKRGSSEFRVPNQINSREELLSNVSDNTQVKFAVGNGQEKIVIP